jgi:hypothetical protein
MKLKFVSLSSTTIAAVVALCGCSFTFVEDYELPPGEESRVVLIRSNPNAEVESVSVNQVPVSMSANTLSVPAGEHQIALRYRVEAGPGCDTIDDLCATTTLRGECSGRVRTLPGRAYLLNLETRFGEVSAQMNAKGLFDLLSRQDEPNLGTLTCNVPLRNDALRRRL